MKLLMMMGTRFVNGITVWFFAVLATWGGGHDLCVYIHKIARVDHLSFAQSHFMFVSRSGVTGLLCSGKQLWNLGRLRTCFNQVNNSEFH
jgi:hypothetical protein